MARFADILAQEIPAFWTTNPQARHDASTVESLRKIVEKTRQHGLGFVIRTIAEGATRQEIEGDVRFLTGLWEEVRRRAEHAAAPALAHKELGVLSRVLRDHFSSAVTNRSAPLSDCRRSQSGGAFADCPREVSR